VSWLQLGDTTNGCLSTGPHFNPAGKTHGAPTDEERHAGDLGNITAGADGVAKIDIVDAQIPIGGPNSIIGRAVVCHELVRPREPHLSPSRTSAVLARARRAPRNLCAARGPRYCFLPPKLARAWHRRTTAALATTPSRAPRARRARQPATPAAASRAE
jgi:hypothetical protein